MCDLLDWWSWWNIWDRWYLYLYTLIFIYGFRQKTIRQQARRWTVERRLSTTKRDEKLGLMEVELGYLMSCMNVCSASWRVVLCYMLWLMRKESLEYDMNHRVLMSMFNIPHFVLRNSISVQKLPNQRKLHRNLFPAENIHQTWAGAEIISCRLLTGNINKNKVLVM